MKSRKLSYLLIVFLISSVAATFVPTAAAHECKDHVKCDAGGCVDGEDHDHTDYNDDQEDGTCKSSAPAGSCKYYGQTHPKLVCDVLEKRYVLPE